MASDTGSNLKGHIGILALAVIFMLLFGIFEKASLGAIIPFVDNILSGKELEIPGRDYAPQFLLNLIGNINSIPRLNLLYWVLGVGAMLILLREVSSFFKTYFMRDVSERVVRDVKNSIYDKLLMLSLDFYSKY